MTKPFYGAMESDQWRVKLSKHLVMPELVGIQSIQPSVSQPLRVGSGLVTLTSQKGGPPAPVS